MRRRLSVVLAVFLLAALASTSPLSAVSNAGTSVGGFEIDGNLADDSGPGEPSDWETPPPNLATFTDSVGQADDIFGRGSKELEPATWQCVTGSTPSKDDITSGAIATRLHLGKQFLYVDFQRAGVSGDAHMDYEFNQSGAPNPACPALPVRTVGDIVVTFDTDLGGKTIAVRAFRWEGSATAGSLVELPVGTQGVTWDAAVNIPNTVAGLEPGAFGEAVLNLTDTIGTVACGQFASSFMKTRASTAISSEIKDRTVPQPLRGFCPRLSLTKAADRTIAGPGDLITYTLTFSNDGDGAATNVVISEPVPAGTAFVSCTGGCATNGSPITDVSWSIGTLAPGTAGSITLTVEVQADVGCAICNVATISSSEQSPLSSNQVCVQGSPKPRPELASAHDSAFGARVRSTLLSLDQTLVQVSSSQSGAGASSQSAQLLGVNIPDPSSEVLHADALRTSSRSMVTAAPAEANHTSVAESANVNVLNGLVTASLVRGVATTSASGASASFSSVGSTFKDLVVNGTPHDNVAPNTRIDVSAVYGPGSEIILYERNGSTSIPAGTQGGTYAADLAVNMIHVHLTDTLPLVAGDQTTDVIVSNAVAHSDFPQTTVCKLAPEQAVSGHAFIASQRTNPTLLPVTFGFVDIPASGGHEHRELNAVNAAGLTASTSVSDSSGALADTASTAASYGEVHDVCVLPGASQCTVGAQLIRAQSNSVADAVGASSNDGGTSLVGATVLGIAISVGAPRNQVVELPGIGFVIFNEQFCDNGAALPSCMGSTTPGHSGLTVRAIRVVITAPDNPAGLPAGAEVIVAEAHSDATFR